MPANTQTIIGSTRYELEVSWSDNGGLAKTYLTIGTADTLDNTTPHPDPDTVAQAVEAWFATQVGYVSSTLTRIDLATTPL